MSRARLLLAGGVLATFAPIALAGAGAAASAPPPTVTLVDDTGVLAIDVPATWTDVDTAPGTNDDGSTMAWISASPDYAAYQQTFDVPGVVFAGVTYTADVQAWIDRLDLSAACSASTTDPYDDGTFTGLHRTWRQCGASGQAAFHTIVANAGADVTRTYIVQVQAPDAATEALVDPLLASIRAVGATAEPPTVTTTTMVTTMVPTPPDAAVPVTVPVTLPDGTPLAPATYDADGAVTAEVFTPANSVVDGAVQVTDDSRSITVAVPPEWTNRATSAVTGSSGAALPQIIATSGDVAVFSDPTVVPTDFTVPGVRFVARGHADDTEELVAGQASAMPCAAGPVQPYSDPVFTGHLVELTACGGTATRIYLVAANPADAALTAVLLIQVPGPSDAEFQTVLSSFDVARSQ